MKLHDGIFWFATFFMAGVALASLSLALWFVMLIAFIFALIFWLRKHEAMALFSLAVIIGFFYFNEHQAANRTEIMFDRKIVFQGIVAKEPEYSTKSQRLDLKLREPYSGEVTAYAAPYPQFHYGDLLELNGAVKISPSGRANIILMPEIRLISEHNGNRIKEFLFAIKNRLIMNLQAVLPAQQAALMSGILLGERAEFSEEFKDAMKKSGTTHIVALSGFNISIIVILISNTFSYFWSRRKSFYVSVVFIILFVLMTGAEASVVRAAIMGIILLLARQASRIYSFRNAITLTAFVMILFDPKLLIFDAGFQLSFAALLGLVYLEPILRKRLPLKKESGFLNWRENLVQTLSAQIAVTPVLLISFGSVSFFSLIANVLILEFIPVTMLFGFITALAGLLSFNLSLIAGFLTGILLTYETFIIHFFSFNWF